MIDSMEEEKIAKEVRDGKGAISRGGFRTAAPPGLKEEGRTAPWPGARAAWLWTAAPPGL